MAVAGEEPSLLDEVLAGLDQRFADCSFRFFFFFSKFFLVSLFWGIDGRH